MTLKRASVLVLTGIFTIITAVLVMNMLPAPGATAMAQAKARSTLPAQPASVAPARASLPAPVTTRESSTPESDRTAAVALTSSSSFATVADTDLAYLQQKNLLLPVAGFNAHALRDSFNDSRSEGRVHQALDIMAPEGTPVLATTDGKLKLHSSARGGIMIYETDAAAPYVYYYGHLQRYADGIYDGKSVGRGEVIAYVGDTGNAGPGNFHLHFGISRVDAPGKWSGGQPINPYPLLSR